MFLRWYFENIGRDIGSADIGWYFGGILVIDSETNIPPKYRTNIDRYQFISDDILIQLETICPTGRPISWGATSQKAHLANA